jgi:integrase
VIAPTPRTIRNGAVNMGAASPRTNSSWGAEPISSPVRRRGRPKRGQGTASAKPVVGKPYKSFPLTPHRNGQFCKKIRGQIYYFGSVNDPDAALKRYHEHCDGLHSGRITEVKRGEDEFTIRDLANRFLEAAEARKEAGELTARTFADYYRDCQRLIKFFGRNRAVESITRDDVKKLRAFLARGVNPQTLNGRVGVTRSIFKFAYDEELIEKPIRFVKDLKRPDRRVMRRSRAEAGRKHFLAAEIRAILDVAPPQLKAMMLLGINCGLGNKDVAELPANCIDLEHGWIDYPRPKTGVQRRCPLWPETIKAIKAVAGRAEKSQGGRRPEAAGLLFVTRKGFPFVRSEPKVSASGQPYVVEHDAIATTLKRIMERKQIAIPGLGFYGLRRSFETIGGETGNQIAVDHVMGHVPASSDMGAIYRQHVAESALRQVTDHVRTWLFGHMGKKVPGVKRVRNTRESSAAKTSARPAVVAAVTNGRGRGRGVAPGTPAVRRRGS